MADNVRLERKGPIATVTLSRPDRRNSLSDEMLVDLVTAFSALRDDDSTRVVIVTGAPPIFSAGADAPFKKGMHTEEPSGTKRAIASLSVTTLDADTRSSYPASPTGLWCRARISHLSCK